MNGRQLAGAAVLAGAGYVLFIRRSATGETLIDQLVTPLMAAQPNIPTKGAGNTSADGPALPLSSRIPSVIGLAGAGTALVGSLLGLGGTTAAAGAAGAAAATGGSTSAVAAGTGIGVGATVAITGGIAGGVVLVWAVWKKGLFRGGEEALLVNPDRDQFLAQFGPRWQGAGKGGPTWEESGNGRLAALLFELDHDSSQRLWKALAAADHIDEFIKATNDIKTFLGSRGIVIQAP